MVRHLVLEVSSVVSGFSDIAKQRLLIYLSLLCIMLLKDDSLPYIDLRAFFPGNMYSVVSLLAML